jgi:hypothetical protein
MASPAPSTPPRAGTSRILVPVRYAAWLNGDLGRTLERTLQHALDPLDAVRVRRLPRGFLVEANEEPGPLLEAVHRAAVELEQGAEAAYPVFHHEMGPVWTGTLQAVFAPPGAAAAGST